jgi:hypothetical protein
MSPLESCRVTTAFSEVMTVRDLVERALTRYQDGPNPEPLACVQTLGGLAVICPSDAVNDHRDDLYITTEAWLASDTVVDVQEVR